MFYNYSKLLGKIKEKFKTQEEFAKALKIGRTSLSARLNCKQDFTQDEMNKAMDLLDIPKNEISDYFFNTKV